MGCVRFSLLCLLALLACVTFSPCVNAQTFDGDALIPDGDTTYEGQTLVVNSGTLTIDGTHTFAGLTVKPSATVTHSARSVAGLNLTLTGDCTIETGGTINTDGRGYGSGQGPGHGLDDTTGSNPGGPGSYGGEGLTSTTFRAGNVYGDLRAPLQLGSGGGSGHANLEPGGAGGGAVRLSVGGMLRVDGSLTANGVSGVNSGGGSGGSIYLTVGSLTGTGSILARGGPGYGGGGRIALVSTGSAQEFLNGGTVSAAGNSRAGSGTLFLKQSSQANGDLWVYNDGLPVNTGTPVAGAQTFDNVRVFGSGTLVPPVGQPLDITVIRDFTVEAESLVSADFRGYGSGQGPGHGADDTSGSSPGGGASHGGEGILSKSSQPGVVYGDLRAPVEMGSGGGGGQAGARPGGAGGGAIRLTVGGMLRVDGSVTANGQKGNFSGGGSGGSIYLTVGSLTGTGSIWAKGSPGSNNSNNSAGGGAGGGGRIALLYSGTAQEFLTGGKISAAAPINLTAYGGQGAGTIFLKHTTQAHGDLWVHNEGKYYLGKAGTPLTGPQTFDNVHVFASGILTSPFGQPLDLTVLGECKIDSGAYISVNGRGYGSGQGPGAGGDDHSGTLPGAGGSYGGRGTATTGTQSGPPYGSVREPIDFGSGGGSGHAGAYPGGAGGGAIRLTVGKTLRVDGSLSANGVNGNFSGGGSGGSLYIHADTLTGTGSILAKGGFGGVQGGNGQSGGGAGGGGRIAILYGVSAEAFLKSGTLSADGNASYGGWGTSENGSAFVGEAPTPVLAGDVSLDQTVDVNDAVIALKFIVGLVVLTDPQMAAGDMDKDGAVLVSDVVQILQKVVGIDG